MRIHVERRAARGAARKKRSHATNKHAVDILFKAQLVVGLHANRKNISIGRDTNSADNGHEAFDVCHCQAAGVHNGHIVVVHIPSDQTCPVARVAIQPAICSIFTHDLRYFWRRCQARFNRWAKCTTRIRRRILSAVRTACGVHGSLWHHGRVIAAFKDGQIYFTSVGAGGQRTRRTSSDGDSGDGVWSCRVNHGKLLWHGQ